MMDGIDLFAYGTAPNFDSLVVQNFISGANGGPLHLLSDPVSPLDAATKEYVDEGLDRTGASTNNTPPMGPQPNQLWFDSVSGQLFIFYQDPNSAQWVIANNTGIQDAPYGQVTFGRQNGTWVPTLNLQGGIMTGPLILSQDPTTYFMAATKGYVDVSLRNYLPLSGGTITGPLTLLATPSFAHDAVNKQYVDTHAGLVTISAVAPANPLEGQLWFDSIGVQLYIWYIDGAGTWVQTNAAAFTEGSAGGGGGGGGIPEPPVTGLIYGRDGSTQTWQPVLPLLGGTMAGPLYLYNSSPLLDDEAASKRYVDDAVSSGTLWQGNYIVATNTPNLGAVTPLDNGYAWTAITQDPNVPELLLINLPGIPVGTPIFNGDQLRYNGVENLWFQLRGSSLTRTEADALYVFRAGDFMTGDLYLAGPPWAPEMAADKQYVDGIKVVVSSMPPSTPFPGQLWYDLAEPNLYVWVQDPTSSQWVIAVNPGSSSPPAGRMLADFNFPPNPADGEIVTTPGGASYRWDAANQRWDYVPLVGSYVNISGDTMTGDLWVTNPSDGTGVIRISGSDQQSMRIRFRKNNAAQWMLDSDETHFRLLNYTPDGSAGRETFSAGVSNTLFINWPQTDHVATGNSDVPNKLYVDQQDDLRVAKTGDTMTGQLRFTNGDIEIDHPANALIRLIAPDASAISFKRNPAVNDPQWVIGVNRSLSGSMAQDSFSFVRFPTGDPNVFDIPLEVDYNGGDVWVNRARARRPDPLFPDELATRQYVDQRFAGESLFIGLLDASTGRVLTVPGHGPPPEGPIPPPDQVPLGAYYICNVAGTVPPNSAQIPNTVFYVGDWLITAGIVWTRIGLGATSGTAANVQVIPDVFGENNVQASLEAAEAQTILRVLRTGDTMIGPLTGPGFICNVDGGGFGTFGNGVYYKRTGGGGLVLRSPAGNVQPQIENNDGSNPRNILDTNNGMPITGGTFTGGIGFGSAVQINALDTSRHIALWGSGSTGFGLSMTTGRMNLVAANATTNRIGFIIGPTGLVVGEFSNTGLELPGVPTLSTHATNKLYVDTAITQAPRVWTAGQAYAVGSTVMFAGLPFTVVTAIASAPATPDFTTIRLSGGNQGDYWQGVPTGWTTDSWLHIATMPAGGTYRMHIDCMENAHTGVYMLDIATTYTKGNITVTTYAPYGNGIFKAFRLSANGSNWNPVRLEAQFAAPATSGQSLKLILTGFANENNNLVSIPKPPVGTANNLGGTEYQLLAINPGTGGNTADPSFLTRAIQTGQGGWIRFPHANATSKDDGRISARLHSRGLNIVGSATEAGDTMRYISLYGDVEVTGTNVMTARTFRARDDNYGFQTFADGWFYKKSGTGIVIRQSSGNQQPQIEDNNGSNVRQILDANNGVRKAGDTMTGLLTMTRTGNDGQLIKLDRAAVGQYPSIIWTHANTLRWGLEMTNTDTGDFQLARWNDAGQYQDHPFVVSRSTGKITVNGPPVNANEVATKAYADGSNAGAWTPMQSIATGWNSTTLRVRWIFGPTLAIELKGTVISGGTIEGAQAGTFCTLPVGFRPNATKSFVAVIGNASNAYGLIRVSYSTNNFGLAVGPGMFAGNVTGATTVYLDGIIISLD